MNLGGILLIGLAVAFVIWLLGKIFQLAMLGWKNALLVGVVVVIGMWAFTRNDSPVAAVPFLDRSVQDVSGQMEGSWTWGQFKQALGGGPVNSSPTTAVGSIPTQAAIIVAPTQVIPQGPTQVSKPAPVHFSATTASGFSGGNQDVCGYDWSRSGDYWVVNLTILCTQSDTPGQAVAVDPRSLTGVKVPLPAIPDNVAAVIAVPTPLPTAVPPTPVPTMSLDEWLARCGQMWLAWATDTGLGTTQTQPGLMALPYGTTWELKGPGELGSWATVSNEKWYLSSTELGITSFQVNGYVGRSIPGNNDNGTIAVTGQNPNICPPQAAMTMRGFPSKPRIRDPSPSSGPGYKSQLNTFIHLPAEDYVLWLLPFTSNSQPVVCLLLQNNTDESCSSYAIIANT